MRGCFSQGSKNARMIHMSPCGWPKGSYLKQVIAEQKQRALDEAGSAPT